MVQTTYFSRVVKSVVGLSLLTSCGSTWTTDYSSCEGNPPVVADLLCDPPVVEYTDTVSISASVYTPAHNGCFISSPTLSFPDYPDLGDIVLNRSNDDSDVYTSRTFSATDFSSSFVLYSVTAENSLGETPAIVPTNYFTITGIVSDTGRDTGF